jgi:O-antigen/teichoic acid export membrane protein
MSVHHIIKNNSIWGPIVRSGSVGLINRVASGAIRLVTIPLLINTLGKEKFGLIAVITSFSGYVLLLDLGLGSALINKLTSLHSSGNNEEASRYFSSGLLFLAAVALVGGVLATAMCPFINWASLFSLTSVSNGETSWAMWVGLMMFFFQLPLSIALKMPYTMQKGALSEWYLLVGNIIGLIGIVISLKAGLGIAVLIIFLSGGQLFASCGVLLHLYVTKQIHFIMDGIGPVVSRLKEVRSTGFHFIIMQVTATLQMALQVQFLAFFHGAESVAVYSVLLQVCFALQIPFTVLQQPLWTKIADLNSRKRIHEIKSLVIFYFIVAGCYSLLAAFVFIVPLNFIFNHFLHNLPYVGLDLRIGFAMWCGLGLMFGGGVGAVILGANLSKEMSLISLGQLAVFIIASFLLVPHYSVFGQVISAILPYAIAIPAALYIFKKRIFVQSSYA